jgi:hypothetical protein
MYKGTVLGNFQTGAPFVCWHLGMPFPKDCELFRYSDGAEDEAPCDYLSGLLKKYDINPTSSQQKEKSFGRWMRLRICVASDVQETGSSNTK